MLSEIYGYASRVKDQDTADAAGQTLSARAMGLYVECSGLISFADPEILSIPEEKLEAFYAEKQKSKLTTEKLFKILICIKSFEIFM